MLNPSEVVLIGGLADGWVVVVKEVDRSMHIQVPVPIHDHAIEAVSLDEPLSVLEQYKLGYISVDSTTLMLGRHESLSFAEAIQRLLDYYGQRRSENV